MRIIADMHTHTNVTTHAYSTLPEMVAGAKRAGLEAIAITNHGPCMPDAPHQWHFYNLDIVPRVIDGVVVLRGLENNIMPPLGGVDPMDFFCYEKMEYILASFHRECFPIGNAEIFTMALENILRNPYITTLAHMGNPQFPFDYEKIISQCNKYGKIMEINNNSVRIRKGSEQNCIEIARLCKKYDVPVMVSSDAHIDNLVGKFDHALGMLEKVDFPEELVINADHDRFWAYMKKIRGLDYAELLTQDQA